VSEHPRTLLDDCDDAKGITTLLDELNRGRLDAFADLIELAYSDLKGVAKNRLRERAVDANGHEDLCPTAVVHEAVMRLQQQRSEWANRQQFFAIATRLMIRVIVDNQRKKLAAKRGGGQIVSLADGFEALIAETQQADPSADLEPLQLGRALSLLHAEHPRAAEVVTLHMMGSMKLGEIADLLGVSLPTVERDWRMAKTCLLEHLEGTSDSSDPVHG